MRYNFDDIFETNEEGKMSCKIDPNSIKSDDEYEFTFHKALREISNENRKILDDWCKAYVAKEYQLGNDIHPGSFTIEQRQVNDSNQVGWDYKLVPNDQNFGVRVNWESIETAPRDGTEILLYDQIEGEVYLGKWIDNSQQWCPQSSEMEVGFWSDDCHLPNVHYWMKIPDRPKKKIPEWQELEMCCKEFYDNVRWENGKPYLIEDIPEEINFCPWCGEHCNKILNTECVNGDESCSEKGNNGVYCKVCDGKWI